MGPPGTSVTGHSSPNNSPSAPVLQPNATSQASINTAGDSSLAGSSTGNAWRGLEQALRALRVTTKICPTLSSAVDDFASCLPIFEAVANSRRREYDELATGLEGIVNQLIRHLDETTSEGVITTITSIAEAIRKEIESIKMHQSGSFPRRMLASSNTEDDLIRRYRRVEQLFRQLQGEASMSTWSTIDELRVEHLLKDLDPAKVARFKSMLSTEGGRRGCTKDTRVTILEGCMSWSEDPTLAKVYWMNGMAGTGKTTIAYTLCERLEARKQLAASFFCMRTSPDCREAKRIIPTIAYQLARRFAPFRYSLCQQLKKDADIGIGELSDQFNLLLKEPLLAAEDKLPNNLVIVIDALDECTDPHIVESFLGLLFHSVMELPVKFFVTSRPEPVIRTKILPESEQSRSILYLHEIEPSLVQADIELYLREELASIAPTDDDITELAEHAGKLFIYAATAVRYIRPLGMKANVRPKARLKEILAISTESQNKLSALYTTILTAAINHPESDSEGQSQRRLVLWTAVCACEPVLIHTLSVLSGLDNTDDTIIALQPLRSVLHVSEHSGLVTTLHASFPDYMFSKDRSGVFYCNRSIHSQLVAERCFKIMKAQLRFNICSIQSSFIPNERIPGLGEQITKKISAELFYSCRFWVDHLCDTNSPDAAILWTYDFLCHRLLLWMEVLSLKNGMVTGAMVMIRLITWLSQVNPGRHVDLFNLASDAQAFVAKYSLSPASAYTPHIYLSALPLTPPSSLVRIQYLPHFKGLIKVSGTIIDNMGKAAIGSWAFASSVRSATFSPSGDLIILGDEKGRISVHNAYGGKSLVQPFKAHRKLVASLTVSSDGMQILSGSHDATLSIWNIHDGSPISGPYEGHTKPVTSVAYSPDAAHIASGSEDCSIRIWSPRNANDPVKLLTGHAKEVKSVAFSPNGSRVISGSTDQTIRVWDLSSESTVLILPGHTGTVSSVQFSPDGAHIISGSNDCTVRIWNASYRSLSRQLKGHSKQVTSAVLSPSGRHIVSGSLDCTVRVWETHSGELVAGPFEGHNGSVISVAILGDGMRVMSASDDKTVRIWNVQGQKPDNEKSARRGTPTTKFTSSLDQTHFASYDLAEPKIHVWNLQTMMHVAILTGADIQFMQFSPDVTRVHSLHTPGTICTWDAQTAELVDGPHQCTPLEKWDTATCTMDGTRVVFCHENKATLWHVHMQSNQSVVLCEAKHLSGRIRATFSQNGSRFLTSDYSFNRISEVWDGDSGTFVAGPFFGEIMGLSFDGTYLCCKHLGGTYELIDINIGGKVRIHTDSDNSSNMVFTPDGLHVAGQDGRFIRTWNTLGHIINSVEITSATSVLKHSKVFGCSSDGLILLSYRVKRGRHHMHICWFRMTSPPFVMSPDGWVMDGQNQPLLWVPADIREHFPGCDGVIFSSDDEVLQRVEYGDMITGDDWSNCYMPATRPT